MKIPVLPRLFLIAFSCAAALNLSQLYAEEIDIPLNIEVNCGAGPSASENLYQTGGIPKLGLFVGNPNHLNRNDRALLKFEITDLILQAENIKSATLRLPIAAYHGRYESIVVEVLHFTITPESLAPTHLNFPDVESVGTVEFKQSDVGQGDDIYAPVQELDILPQLKASLAAGETAIAFRLRASHIEEEGNVHLEATGVSITKTVNMAPVIRVEVNNP